MRNNKLTGPTREQSFSTSTTHHPRVPADVARAYIPLGQSLADREPGCRMRDACLVRLHVVGVEFRP